MEKYPRKASSFRPSRDIKEHETTIHRHPVKKKTSTPKSGPLTSIMWWDISGTQIERSQLWRNTKSANNMHPCCTTAIARKQEPVGKLTHIWSLIEHMGRHSLTTQGRPANIRQNKSVYRNNKLRSPIITTSREWATITHIWLNIIKLNQHLKNMQGRKPRRRWKNNENTRNCYATQTTWRKGHVEH